MKSFTNRNSWDFLEQVIPSCGKRVGCTEQVLTRKSMKNHWFCLGIHDFHGFRGGFWRFFPKNGSTNIILDAGHAQGWILGHLWKFAFFIFFQHEKNSRLNPWFMLEIRCVTTSAHNRDPYRNRVRLNIQSHSEKCSSAGENFRVENFWKIFFQKWLI